MPPVSEMGNDGSAVTGQGGMLVLKRLEFRPFGERRVGGIGGLANDDVHADFSFRSSAKSAAVAHRFRQCFSEAGRCAGDEPNATCLLHGVVSSLLCAGIL